MRFVHALAQRIVRFPDAGHAAVKEQVNAISLAPIEDFRHDSDLFRDSVRSPETQRLTQVAMSRGVQTRGAKLRLGGDLP